MKKRRSREPDQGDLAASIAGAAQVVLEATRRGRDELERPSFGLSGNQRRLLTTIDGRRSLRECASADPALKPERLSRDAARLVAFGLARQVSGELPNELMVAAMNLTAQIPLDRLPPLDPDRTVHPMLPRVAPSPHSRPQTPASVQAREAAAAAQSAPAPTRQLRSRLLLTLFLIALLAVLGWLATLQ